MSTMTEYFPFDPNPRAPAFSLPEHAADAQFHVFGPEARYPTRPGAAYTMPTATIERALEMHAAVGLSRGVIVQPTTYGTDNSALLDALEIAGPNYRGCTIGAVLNEKFDVEIEALDRAGVHGARFNFLGSVNLRPDPESFRRSAARAAELGWYIKIQPGQDGILDSVDLYEEVKTAVVIDHMGRAAAREGVDGPNARKVRELLRKGNFWVLLSNAHKLSEGGEPWEDVIPVARSFIDAAPDRILWATDWPHPLSKTPPPNDGALLDLLGRVADSESTIRQILVSNPAELFRLPPVH